MNALVSIESIGILTPATVFAPGGVEGILCKIESEVRAIDRDISTPDGRENVKSLAYKVARSKTALDDMGKELVSGIKAQAATIDAERRTIRDRLDALKEEVRGPLTAWEDAEAARVDFHEKTLTFIISSDRFDHVMKPSVATIRERIADIAVWAGRDWQEFKERADEAIAEALHKLNAMKETAEQHERDAAELAELRRLKAEREEALRRLKAEREARDATAERARLDEIATANRLAAQAKADTERAEQAQRDQEAAAARAVEQERQRAAAAKAAEEQARQKREANTAHRKKVLRKIIDAMVAAGIPATTATILAVEIDEGKIPHVSITY